MKKKAFIVVILLTYISVLFYHYVYVKPVSSRFPGGLKLNSDIVKSRKSRKYAVMPKRNNSYV